MSTHLGMSVALVVLRLDLEVLLLNTANRLANPFLIFHSQDRRSRCREQRMAKRLAT
jgi:hypothetical protein